MARLIVKSPYIKCGGNQGADGYMRYIATRERVEIIPDDRPPTNKQTQLIAKLVKDFPDAKELMEYEDYLSHPTKATASALITLALESGYRAWKVTPSTSSVSPGKPVMKVDRIVMSGHTARQAAMRSRFFSTLAGRFIAFSTRGCAC